MVEPERLLILERKLLELKKHRDELQREVAAGASDITALEDQLRRLCQLVETKRRTANEKLTAAKRFDGMIADAQAGLHKLSENAKRLESVLDNELLSAMGKTPH